MFILLFGTIGNVLNLLIFYQPKHRTNPCAVYFFYASIAGLIALYSGLLSRFFVGFSLDASATNAIICKLRAFIVWVSTTASSWFLTYATIDRYFISCRDVQRRSLSNLRFTRRLMIITVVGGSLIFAETFYCYIPNLRNSPLTCYGQNMICRLYNEIASAVVFVFIPSTIMLIFGYATVQNVRKLLYPIVSMVNSRGIAITMKKTDRQLIQMLIVQIILLTIFNIPLAIQRLYLTSTLNIQKSLLRSTIENLCFQVFYLLSFMSFGMPFYIYTLTGTVFRHDCINLIRSVYRKVKIAVF
ncbi:unnamed protein product [Rotaria sp. Silwood1]|nr:unnamed protein product [Rotaria sp. Silwood1]CAF1135116.1 unnamed protein product [Rotaria sp. Silwood1]CAF3446489.1 unnamed protein product [Rotaria sp. Silwood1]CAF3452745.1 unnamed protein product [Rotaria sp. Silwood1]CAF4573280.1 unnamed protein product [Rotaria sp. Silwood1]